MNTPCTNCSGSGKVPYWLFFKKECDVCHGAGEIYPKTFGRRTRPEPPPIPPPAATVIVHHRAPGTPVVVDEGGDPLEAAVIASALGGDALTAAGTAMLTGNTGLGVLAGMMAGDEERREEAQAEAQANTPDPEPEPVRESYEAPTDTTESEPEASDPGDSDSGDSE